MSPLALTAAVLGATLYIPTCVQVWRGKIQLNLASFVLWALLDLIATASILANGGNWLLPGAYTLGCSLVVIAILKTANFQWSRAESFTAVLVILSIVVWLQSGPVMATIVSTLAVVTAGMPQLWDILRKPENGTLWLWSAFTLVNGLSTLAGQDWSVSERFYPGCCFIFTSTLTVLTLRKFLRTPVTA